MGPRSVERGKVARAARLPRVVFASMGPRSVERGKWLPKDGANGFMLASMGPRSVERGKPTRCRCSRGLSSLQWGRVLLNAESTRATCTPLRKIRLQWGRVLLNAESYYVQRTDGTATLLQWGRVLLNAESTRRPGRARAFAGFNGAAFC